MTSMYKRLYYHSFVLFAILIFAASTIILIICISINDSNLLLSITVFGSTNANAPLPAKENVSSIPTINNILESYKSNIIKSNTLSVLSTIPLGYGEPESIRVNPKTNTIYLATTHYDALDINRSSALSFSGLTL